MPIDSLGNYIESKADITIDAFGFGEIGGVGQLIYHLFTFEHYELEYPSSGGVLLRPEYLPGNKPNLCKDDGYIGAELLVSLYNLAKRIDDHNEPKGHIQLIAEWCEKVAHPYFIDDIHAQLTSKDFDANDMEYLYRVEAAFSVEDFMRDLERLYHTATYFFAIEQMMKGNDDFAFSLGEDGRYFQGVNAFTQYKTDYDSLPEIDVSGAMGNLLKEMKLVKEAIKDVRLNSMEEGFADVPFDHFDDLMRELVDVFPHMRLKLKYSPKSQSVIFVADVHSVFDIAWYTLAHNITETMQPRLKAELEDMDRSERPVVLSCPICGKAFLRRNNRQTYCKSKECYNKRKAINQKLFRDRQKVAKAQSDNN